MDLLVLPSGCGIGVVGGEREEGDPFTGTGAAEGLDEVFASAEETGAFVAAEEEEEEEGGEGKEDEEGFEGVV